MPLREHEKEQLLDELALLIEADEAEAILATLGRLAKAKAASPSSGSIERRRWTLLATAVASAKAEFERAHEPQRRQQGEPPSEEASSP